MTHSFSRLVAPFVTALLLVACASTDGQSTRASLGEGDQLAAADSLAGAKVSPAAWPRADWWKQFGDAQLDGLIDEALAGSPTLKVAEARTRKAVAAADSSRAALFPQVNADLQMMRERFSDQGLFPPPVAGTWSSLNQLQASLSWEIDLWGKNRAAYESALGEARAADVDAYAARIALSVAVAQTYVELQRAYLQLDVAEETLREREQIYALTRERNAAGIDSRLELKQAETALPAARERIVELREATELARHQLAALLGEGPDRGLAVARPDIGSFAPRPLPSTLPAELLGRRPDIVAQRWRVEAARKDIDVAKAEFYPNFDLLAFIGFQSIGTAGFLSAASRMMGIGPAVSLPIFEGGRLRANLAGRDADYDIAVERYNQTLADAMRDVVDQVSSARSVEEQRVEERLALATAQEAYDLALLRYREGLGNYLQVLSAENPLLEQRSLDAELRARELELSIALVRALGGGYEAASLPVASAGSP
jgi:NodT family efflux transporter outer membrane factor (OMF) lipoprotein